MAATRKRNIEIDFLVEDRDARKSLQQIAKSTDQTGKSFTALGGIVKAGLAAFGAREALQAIQSLDQLNAKMEATNARADTVFGEMSARS